MANIKKYQAPTLREALEYIKQDLGEEALVIGHRKVKLGSLFGVGGRDVVEVSVAANKTVDKEDRGNVSTMLNNPEQSKSNIDIYTSPGSTSSSRLAARAYAIAYGHNNESSIPTNHFELTEETPKIVHTPVKKATPANNAPATESKPSQNETNFGNDNIVIKEMHRLQAEVKELKFSLASFLPNIPSPTKGIESLHNDLPELYDSPYYEAYITLTNTGLDPKIARQAIEYCINLFHAQGFIEADRLKVANIGLSYTLQQLLHFSEDPTVSSDTLTSPNGIVFIGPTGVGKTTTLAKIAAHVSLRVRQRVELITLDTYRIAAIEQLKTYAEIIGAGFHVAHSVVELNALTTRLAGKGLMLIDTAGRSPNDLADQLELANYLKEDCSLLKCLVLQATTHPIDADLAVKKFSLYGPDQLVLTKLDETARPGASVSIAMNSKLPLTYLCAGQKIPNDINLADCKTFTNHILRASLSVN